MNTFRIFKLLCLMAMLGMGAQLCAMDPKTGEQELVSIIQKEGRETDVRQLLEAGVSPNIYKNGSPILYLAALDGRKGNVNLLLEYGADPNAKNAAGDTALHMLMNCRRSAGDNGKKRLRMARGLLDAGANIFIQNDKGATPLHRACNKGWLKGIQLLLNYGKAFLYEPDEYGQTLMSVLINIQDDYGWTPLYALMSCVDKTRWDFGWRDFWLVVWQFLDHGAHINTPAADGTTVLDLLEQKKVYVSAQQLEEHALQMGGQVVQIRMPQYKPKSDMFKQFRKIRRVRRKELFTILEMLRRRPERTAGSAFELSQYVQNDHGGFGLLPLEILHIILAYALEHDRNYIDYDEQTLMQRKLLAMKDSFDGLVKDGCIVELAETDKVYDSGDDQG